MSFLKQFRPGGSKGTPQQLLEIKSLRAKRDSLLEAHELELKEIQDRLADVREEAVIKRGINAHRAEMLAQLKAENIALATDSARMRSDTAKLRAELAAQREQTRREAIELASTCGIHQPERF